MEKNSSNQNSNSYGIKRKEELKSNYFFDNELVERLLYRYKETSCTSIQLRDEIMEHASILIDNLIKAFNLRQITPGKEEKDLFQVAWCQIESALYKYNALPYCRKCYNPKRPSDSLIIDQFETIDQIIKTTKNCPKCKTKFRRGNHPQLWFEFNGEPIEGIEDCNIYFKGTSKIFNYWSQIARTVILAHIKKESRDRKNNPLLKNHLEEQPRQKDYRIGRFLEEARTVCTHHEEYQTIINALETLYESDEKPHEGIIIKLITITNLPKSSITSFLRFIRLMGNKFTDNPINNPEEKYQRREDKNNNEEE